jgi:prepilin-type N-terminal cleavage/methylation domain-containing protein
MHGRNWNRRTGPPAPGFTLVEIMIAILLASVVILSATAFRYASALDVRKSDIQSTGARIALALLEGWRTSSSPVAYDPVAFHGATMAISTGASGPPTPSGFTALGIYDIVSNRVHYYARLSYRARTGTDPLMLNVSVGWKPQGAAGDVSTQGHYFRTTSYD